MWTTALSDGNIQKNNELLNPKIYKKNRFYTYQEVRNIIKSLKRMYPSISSIDTIGYSILGNPIWLFRISGKNNTDSKQRFFLNGAMHGNEKMGTEIVLSISRYLLGNYHQNQDIKDIIDRSEILLVPVLNPDGYMSHIRWLSTGDDPNRSFGWQLNFSGSKRICHPFNSPEIRAYRRILLDSPWYASFDYHTGIVGLFVPWMCSSKQLPDRSEYEKISEVYNLDSSDDFSLSRGNKGESIDYSYAKYGTMSFLPEVHRSQDSVPPDDYTQIIEKNIRSFISVVKEMQKGIKGKVIDAESGSPVFARIEVKNNGSSVYTDHKSGSFYKYICEPSGIYEINVSANGYETRTVRIDARISGFTTADIELFSNPKKKYAAISVDAIRVSDDLSYSEYSSILGMHDSVGIPLHSNGFNRSFITVDMGPSTIITDREGFDFTVYSNNNDTYYVSVVNSIDGFFENTSIIGTGRGTTSFDLENCSLDSARYVQISSMGECPIIDAVECEPRYIPPAFAVTDTDTYSLKKIISSINTDSTEMDNHILISGEEESAKSPNSQTSTIQQKKDITNLEVPSF
jgi:hypothetical protein